MALTLSQLFKAWRFSARADDDLPSICDTTSQNDNPDDESSDNEKVRQKDKEVSQASLTALRLLSLVFLILVLVSAIF